MMNRFKNFASRSPISFGFVVTLIFIVMVIVSAVFANRWPAESAGWYLAGTVVRLVCIAILMTLIALLGWLEPAGFTRPGRWQIWLLTLLLLVYGAFASAFALTGSLNFSVADPALVGVMAVFIMTHALFEEIAFRGLVMTALLNKWGSTTPGIIKGVVASACFFAAMHLLNLLGGNSLPIVLLQSAGAFFLGILFGGLVVSGRSIYPAAILHGLLNLTALLNLVATGSDGSDLSAWLIQSLLIVPMGLVGIYLLRTAPTRLLAPKLA